MDFHILYKSIAKYLFVVNEKNSLLRHEKSSLFMGYYMGNYNTYLLRFLVSIGAEQISIPPTDTFSKPSAFSILGK